MYHTKKKNQSNLFTIMTSNEKFGGYGACMINS